MDYGAVRARLEGLEGRTSWFYLDTKGVVTIGIGHAVPTPSAAVLLPWAGSVGRADVVAAFERVHAAERGHGAGWYQPLTHIRLLDAAIDAVAGDDIARIEKSIAGYLPESLAWPAKAREGLFDIAYNCGPSGLLRFPHMLAACRAGNWELAAVESYRPEVSAFRNSLTAGLFRAMAPGETRAGGDFKA